MAWCPKCKNEYRDGVTVCADCGCELIAEEQFDDLVPFIFGEEDQMNSLKKYLEYNHLQGVTVKFSEEENVFELLVRENDRRQATTMARVFLQQQALEKEAGEDTPADGANVSSRPTVYLNSTERAEENRSSAWMLLLVGTMGLVIMILGMLNVIPLRLGNPYMFYGVMCAVFVLFIIMGVVSMKNAKIFAKKAESENTLRDTMTKWYQENLNASAIDADIGMSEDIADEILYFRRVQLIKEKLNHQFINLDQDFLEHYIDEEVYDFIFSGEE